MFQEVWILKWSSYLCPFIELHVGETGDGSRRLKWGREGAQISKVQIDEGMSAFGLQVSPT